MSTPTSPSLAAAVVRTRRAELGLSARQVAEALGVSPPSYLALEGGYGGEVVELRTLVRLSQILGLSLDTLVGGSQPEGTDDASSGDGDDAATLGALLYATGTLTPVGALCEVLDWTYDRLHAAEGELAQRLARSGLRLHRHTGRLAIARGVEAVEAETLKTAVRRQLGRENVSLAEAKMVRRIQQGRAPQVPSNSEAVTFGVLTNAGLVTFAKPTSRGTEAAMVLSDDVRYGLLLDE